MLKTVASAVALGLAVQGAALARPALDIRLEVLGTYETGIFDEGAAEIVAYDRRNKYLFVINSDAGTVDVLDINDPTAPFKVGSISTDAIADSGGINSVDVHGRLVALAVENDDAQAPGWVAFYNTDGPYETPLNVVEVGALPDMVTFTPNGRAVLVANEGEPDDDYDVDPEGSVSIVDLRFGVASARVRTADFTAYDGQEDALRAQGVRIFGPGASASQDLEPEYVAVSRNSRTAWVALQENNALAVVDIPRAEVTDILPLGTKDHAMPGNGIDASDRDDETINIANWPVHGMYQPDTIATYRVRGEEYVVTANEGDARDYDGFSEEERIEDLDLDPDAFPNAADLQQEAALGRLQTTSANGDEDGDGDFDKLYSYGARSFSIWTGDGQLVWDSGDDFERITADLFPADFNSDNDENDSFDSRSDAKGPEPEAVELGRIRGRTFAFVGLERIGGIMVYEVTDPHAPRFIEYVNNRDFAVDAELGDGTTNPEVGDLGPESIRFIPRWQSPTRTPILAVGNEVSGTTTLYAIDVERPRPVPRGRR